MPDNKTDITVAFQNQFDNIIAEKLEKKELNATSKSRHKIETILKILRNWGSSDALSDDLKHFCKANPIGYKYERKYASKDITIPRDSGSSSSGRNDVKTVLYRKMFGSGGIEENDVLLEVVPTLTIGATVGASPKNTQ